MSEGSGNPLPACHARFSMTRPRFLRGASLAISVQPLVRFNETVPGDWARAQMQQRRPSAMHPTVLLASLRSQ